MQLLILFKIHVVLIVYLLVLLKKICKKTTWPTRVTAISAGSLKIIVTNVAVSSVVKVVQDGSLYYNLRLCRFCLLVHRLRIPNGMYALRQNTVYSKGLKRYRVVSLFSVPPAKLWNTPSIRTRSFHPNPSKFITNYSFYQTTLESYSLPNKDIKQTRR